MRITILQNLELLTEDCSSDNDTEQIQNIVDVIIECLSVLEEKLPDKKNEIAFLTEQLQNINVHKNGYHYSVEWIIFTSLLYTISPYSYNFIRNFNYMIMPHPRTVQRISSRFSVNPMNENFDENFLYHIKQKYQNLTDMEKIVVLMMDEIHLKPCFDFKGGNISGQAVNSNTVACSAYVFMIQSLLSQYEDVAHILPVK